LDLSQKKCDLIEENRARSGFTNMKIQVWDALKFDAELENSCDIVVADVPCSGLGVLAEKPDIKYRVQPEELQSLAELSKQILKNAYRYIKPGGTLLFSTCTMNPTENTACREWLLQEFPLKPIAFDTALTKQMLEIGNNRETAKKGYLELFTTDCYHGFFISKFIKV
jgi:16S rRNA (cytosine967-C5)-methyltransferase